jgi:hypothetical protein
MYPERFVQLSQPYYDSHFSYQDLGYCKKGSLKALEISVIVAILRTQCASITKEVSFLA